MVLFLLRRALLCALGSTPFRTSCRRRASPPPSARSRRVASSRNPSRGRSARRSFSRFSYELQTKCSRDRSILKGARWLAVVADGGGCNIGSVCCEGEAPFEVEFYIAFARRFNLKTGKAVGGPSGLIGKRIGFIAGLAGSGTDVPVYPCRKGLGGNVEVLINANAKAQCAGLSGTATATDSGVGSCALFIYRARKS